MSRRSGDVVHVRSRATGPAQAPQPSAFVWHERLYVVREVLGHWHERTPWWEDAGRALHGVDGADGAPAPAAGPLGADEEVWRVAASAGQRAPVGTYDLGRPGGGPGWRLLRVVD